jgi:Flp pilus assembly protein TadG
MGAPVQVSLPGNAQALITASGPAGDPAPAGATPNSSVTGTITVTVTPSAGTVRLSVADLVSRDQTGSPVTLTAQGPASLTASPGHPATLKVTGTFHTGGAQINWQQAGHVLAIWDFTVEND